MYKFLALVMKATGLLLLVSSFGLFAYSLFSVEVSKVFGLVIFGGCLIIFLMLYSLAVIMVESVRKNSNDAPLPSETKRQKREVARHDEVLN